jgi:hypothetical protein
MTVTATARTSSAPAAVKVAPFAKGKGADSRNVAFGDVSTFAYIEGKSRAETIATLRLALGAKPTDAQLEACKLAYVVGRVAARIGADKSVADAIDFARDVVTCYAAPVKDGVAARKLRKGQKGRRTIEQQRAMRAAEEAWSQVKAEAAPAASNATTQADRNKAKRAPAMKGTTARGAAPAAGTGITHSELVKPDGAPMDRAAATSYAVNMAATLLAFTNKHAGVMPTDMAVAIKAFHAAARKVAGEVEALTGADAD